jgi:hypothetical protein
MTADDRLKAALQADTLAQFDAATDRVTAVLAAVDRADASSGVHRITEEAVFDGLWGRQYPTGRGQWVYLDANAARAIAKRVVTISQETAGTR